VLHDAVTSCRGLVESMRVLIIAFFFPPCPIIGSLRVGKTAKYLHRFGHEVRVVACAKSPSTLTAPVEIPSGNVSYTDWVDVDVPYQRLLSTAHAVRRRLRGRTANEQPRWLESASARLHGNAAAKRSSRRLAERLRVAYQDIVHVPDASIGWYYPALREARRVAR
jgi:hypothetical protein